MHARTSTGRRPLQWHWNSTCQLELPRLLGGGPAPPGLCSGGACHCGRAGGRLGHAARGGRALRVPRAGAGCRPIRGPRTGGPQLAPGPAKRDSGSATASLLRARPVFTRPIRPRPWGVRMLDLLIESQTGPVRWLQRRLTGNCICQHLLSTRRVMHDPSAGRRLRDSMMVPSHRLCTAVRNLRSHQLSAGGLSHPEYDEDRLEAICAARALNAAVCPVEEMRLVSRFRSSWHISASKSANPCRCSFVAYGRVGFK